MKRLVILGAGTAGTMMLNKLSRVLNKSEWHITIIDESETHYYQPGFLFIPFDIYSKSDVVKPKKKYFPSGITSIISQVKKIESDHNRILLNDESIVPYDFLIVASGARIVPEQTEGLKDILWHKNIFDFYTIEGALSLSQFFKQWQGGKLVINITEMPIKCPVAPLEFAFLADWYFTKHGIRNKVEIQYVTPLSGAFTKPKASAIFGDFLERKNIHLVPDFNIARVDNQGKKIISWDEQEIQFDLLVSIPTNMGDSSIARSSMGDELNFIPTKKHTLQSEQYANVFVIGDATNLPSSKAGSVAHFQGEILFKNILSAMDHRSLEEKFDGHANCFIESGFGKGILIDFNYEAEPLPGMFPLPVVGPFSLLKETSLNHYGKMMFRWIYWNILLKGYELPLIESQMSMSGKEKEAAWIPEVS